MNFVAFGLIIDDIVFPNGQTAMGVLGGGGPQTAFGMKLWVDQVGLVAGVGSDLPAEALAWLKASDIDIAGLRYSGQWATLRAWQLLEADGRRTQVWRIADQSIGPQLARSFEQLPPNYRHARGYHLGVHPEEPDLEFIKALRDSGAVVSIEPYRHAVRPLSQAELRALVSAGQIFSPNQAEAGSLVGPGEPLEVVRRLAEVGAEIVTLRQGENGAIVHRADTGETWQIPVVQTFAQDPTGAGNAFCGGFLAGWVEAGDLCLAGLYGAVAAGFLVEQVGLPAVDEEAKERRSEEAKRRLAILQTGVARLA